MKRIILLIVFLTVINYAGFFEGVSAANNVLRENRMQQQQYLQNKIQRDRLIIQREKLAIEREKLRQKRLILEAKDKEINFSMKNHSNNTRYFKTEKGTRFSVVYNKHGAILKSKSYTIYLGKSCDAISQRFGSGKWRDGRHMGFSIQFQNKEIIFPMQQILIKNNIECI